VSDEDVVETEYVDVGEGEGEGEGEGDESDFEPDENMIPETKQEVYMGGFHFEVEANLEQNRKKVDKIDLDSGIPVNDLNEFESKGNGVDDE
jgi:hypothetical protein